VYQRAAPAPGLQKNPFGGRVQLGESFQTLLTLPCAMGEELPWTGAPKMGRALPHSVPRQGPVSLPAQWSRDSGSLLGGLTRPRGIRKKWGGGPTTKKKKKGNPCFHPQSNGLLHGPSPVHCRRNGLHPRRGNSHPPPEGKLMIGITIAEGKPCLSMSHSAQTRRQHRAGSATLNKGNLPPSHTKGGKPTPLEPPYRNIEFADHITYPRDQIKQTGV